MTLEVERRCGTPLEVRAASDGMVRVSGYAAVFNQPTNIGDVFMEVIAPGAFRNAISRGDDVEFLINHGGLPLARSTAGNLSLREDDHGLHIEADLDPNDPDVARILPKMKRKGQLDQMSFAFQIPQGGQRWADVPDELPVRTVTDTLLFDVSIVNRGAYPTTSIGLRSLEEARKGSDKDKAQAERNAQQAQARIAARKAQTEQKIRGISR
jgi:HK97 family phage prohead protease